MTDDNAAFWIDRHDEVGHTGWKDNVIYAYDQLERLAIVSEWVDKLSVYPYLAIDFGCGVGDFSRLLLKKGFKVYGYDPYINPRLNNLDFTYIASKTELERIADNQAGLGISITVMDHILNDCDLLYQLGLLRRMISDSGFLILLEYALDAGEFKESASDYQAFRTIDIWERLLMKSGWHIKSLTPMPHPQYSPSEGYLSYKNSFQVRVLRRFIRHRLLRPLSHRLLQTRARWVINRSGFNQAQDSPLKLMCCVPNMLVTNPAHENDS